MIFFFLINLYNQGISEKSVGCLLHCYYVTWLVLIIFFPLIVLAGAQFLLMFMFKRNNAIDFYDCVCVFLKYFKFVSIAFNIKENQKFAYYASTVNGLWLFLYELFLTVFKLFGVRTSESLYTIFYYYT